MRIVHTNEFEEVIASGKVLVDFFEHGVDHAVC